MPAAPMPICPGFGPRRANCLRRLPVLLHLNVLPWRVHKGAKERFGVQCMTNKTVTLQTANSSFFGKLKLEIRNPVLVNPRHDTSKPRPFKYRFYGIGSVTPISEYHARRKSHYNPAGCRGLKKSGLVRAQEVDRASGVDLRKRHRHNSNLKCLFAQR